VPSLTRPPCDEGVLLAGTADAPCAPSARPWVLAATILGSSLAFIDASTVNVALPALQASLGASVTDIGWIINAYTLFLAALILLGGSLGDHYGRRRVYALGVVVFALASAWCGLAPTTGQLILARALQGVGGALLVPGSLALISASFGDAERGGAIGLWSGFSAMTSALGPVLGGWLIDTLSWRWIFFINLPLAVLVLFFLTRVPESRDPEAGRLDLGGAVLATLGLGALTHGLLASGTRGLGDTTVLLALGIGTAALVSFVALETRLANPMVSPKLFRSRTFSGTNLLTLLLYGALSGALFFLPLNLIQVQGYSATAAGAALLPFVILLSLLSRWSGGLISRLGARLPLTVGPLVVALGFGLFILPGIGGSYWTTFFPGAVVLGLGMAVTVAPLTAAVMGSVPGHYAGTASGINNAASRVAGLLAIALFGLLMLAVFSGALRGGLAGLGLSAQAEAAVYAQRVDLAALEPPAELSAAQQGAVRQAVNSAYLTGFRVVMGVSAGLALLSALIAWRMVEGRGLKKDSREDRF
jgi:EmrB/QacA subfamily drug resistance transporter